MRRASMILATGAMLLAVTPAAEAVPTRTYEVTIENLTDGQPFSPPIAATHKGGLTLFRVRRPASEGIQQIAENGNNGPMRAFLESSPSVHDIAEASEPLVPEGTPGSAMFDDEVTLTLESTRGARFLAFATMLICTNDGFTGTGRARPPAQIGQQVVLYAVGYDAGTEINTEDYADMVEPCQALIAGSVSEPGTGETDPALAENGVVHLHQGIQGIADLDPDVHGWTEPVARVTIERVA
jgi:hypothetical protein